MIDGATGRTPPGIEG